MKTNLRATWDNAYWRVRVPVRAFLLVGHSESNTYIGASQLLGNVYRHVELQPGDELHALHGGIFAVTKDGVFGARPHLSEKHPFEKVYLPPSLDWPLAMLEPIPKEEARQVRYRAIEPPRLAPGRPVGRSIDSIID